MRVSDACFVYLHCMLYSGRALKVIHTKDERLNVCIAYYSSLNMIRAKSKKAKYIPIYSDSDFIFATHREPNGLMHSDKKGKSTNQ